jgi:hypothetical protein
MLWQTSCARPDSTGRCVIAKRLTVSARCTPTIVLQAAPRNAALVREARREFEAAVAEFERIGEPNDRARAAQAAAQARFLLAEPDAIALMVRAAPSMREYDHLDPKRAPLLKQFSAWMETFQKDASRFTTNSSNALADPGAAEWRNAAMLRAAQVQHAFADHLTSAEIPTTVAKGPHGAEAVRGYCDQLERQTAPLINASHAALEACLATPRMNEWSLACARQLEQWDPTSFAPMRERLGTAPRSPILDRGPALLER